MNLVPSPGPLVNAYADCLRANNVAVSEIVGVWVVISETSSRAVSAAADSCRDESAELAKSLGMDGGNKVADQAGQTIVHRMYWCMDYYADIDLPRDTLIFNKSADSAATKQWDKCVALARQYVPNSDPPTSIDPSHREPSSPDADEPRVEETP